MSESNKSSGGILAILLVLFLGIAFLPATLLIMLGGSQASAASECRPVQRTTTSSEAPSNPPQEKENKEDSDQVPTLDKAANIGTVNVPSEYVEPIKKAAEVSGLPASVVAKQIQVESNFNRFAQSPVGAKGPAQFMDATWATFGNGGDVFDIEDAMAGYGRYMKHLSEQVEEYANGDPNLHVKLTLAAYNAGPGAVAQFKGIPPYAETKNYVEKILSGAQVEFSPGCQQVSGGKAWDGDLGPGEWTNPCPGCVFTSPYGWRNIFPPGDWRNEHVGVDLATPGVEKGPGTVIIAPTDMTVVGFLEKDGCVTTKQDGEPGFGFNFCHLHSWDVTQGQKLKRGDIIGIEGGTGMGAKSYYATHLHFEIYDPSSPVPGVPYNGHNIDPEPILKEKGAWVTP